MLAELNGKISSTGSNLSDRLEDQLTSDFFGSLRYIPFDQLMGPIFKKTNIMGDHSLHINTIIGQVKPQYWADKLSFWPYHPLGELDLILEFEEILIGIEVKLYSGLSSDDEESYRQEEKKRSINQLARESRVLKEKVKDTKKPAVLIFIAPEDQCRSICTTVHHRKIIEDGVELAH